MYALKMILLIGFFDIYINITARFPNLMITFLIFHNLKNENYVIIIVFIINCT